MYHINEDQRSIHSKNMLYRALADKLREKDLSSITIKEVVSDAQMGRSTFYRNFHSLESVLLWKCDAAFDELYHYILRSFSPALVASKFPFALPFFRYWQADSEIIELLIQVNRVDIIISSFDNALKKLIKTFNPGMMDQSPHFEYFLAFRSGAMIRILFQWLNRSKDLSPEELCQLIEAQAEGIVRNAPLTSNDAF
jgi:hypothetical protein